MHNEPRCPKCGCGVGWHVNSRYGGYCTYHGDASACPLSRDEVYAEAITHEKAEKAHAQKALDGLWEAVEAAGCMITLDLGPTGSRYHVSVLQGKSEAQRDASVGARCA